MPRPRYEELCQVASRTELNKRYAIKRNLDTNVVSCGCPSWRFQKGAPEVRSCKHLEALQIFNFQTEPARRVAIPTPAPRAAAARVRNVEEYSSVGPRAAVGAPRLFLFDE